jgi:hypothetical protein
MSTAVVIACAVTGAGNTGGRAIADLVRERDARLVAIIKAIWGGRQ